MSRIPPTRALFSTSLPVLGPCLLATQHLNPDNLLNHPHILRLLINHTLQILQTIPQILNLPVIKVCRVLCILLHKITRPNVNDYVFGIGKFSGDVERGRQG